MATFKDQFGNTKELDPNFTPIPMAKAVKIPSVIRNAQNQGITPEEFVISRGGVNAAGYFGDSYGINSSDGISLTDAEYKAALESGKGKYSGASGAAINLALAEKIKAATGKYPAWWAGAKAANDATAAANGVPVTAPVPTTETVTPPEKSIVSPLPGPSDVTPEVTPIPTPEITFTEPTPTPKPVIKTVGTFTDPASGDVYALREDGSKELLSKGTKEADTLSAKEEADAKAAADEYTAKMVADAKTQEIQKERQSAYQILKDEFTKYDLGDDKFLEQVKNLILTGTPASQATLKLRGTDEYAVRFAGNQERRNAGKNVYDEATYLSLENQYRETFGAYGLDNLLGDTETSRVKLAQYIAQDKSPLEIKKRVQMAVEQVQNRTDVRMMFAEYYPEITDKDLVSYFLEPKDTLASLENKVNVAKIGSTAMRQGLVADINTSQALSEMGLSEEQAALGYKNVAAVLPEAQKLSELEGEKYTQAEAEGAYLKNLASEQRKIDKLGERERARFAGSSGVNKTSLTTSTKGQLY